MKNLRQLGAVCTCLIVVSFNASAAIISVDWKTSGDNLITRDTISGLEWLDLTVTADTTFNDVLLQQQTGGYLEGWSFAWEYQVIEFFNHFGGSGIYTGYSYTHQVMFDNGLLDY